MRTIKFRAWQLETKKMYRVGGFFKDCATNEVTVRDEDGSQIGGRLSNNFSEIKEKWNVILMQYTGLKDKKGKEIYEGDILRRNSFLPDIGKVQYHNHMAGYWVVTLHEELGIDSLEHFTFQIEIEVIGNIYENPELLKEKNEDK